MNTVLDIVAGVLSFLMTLVAAPAAQNQPAGPAPEMTRLAQSLVGNYTIVERHHARPGAAEWAIDGTVSFRPGPDGMSLVENYQSNNPKGPFTAIAVIWWDQAAGVFRHFQCETGEPCGVVDDTGTWQGQRLVFARQIERQGRKVKLEEGYDFAAAPATIVYSTRFSVDGGPWTTSMTITHTRVTSQAGAASAGRGRVPFTSATRPSGIRWASFR